MADEAVAKLLTVSIERQEGAAVVRLRGKLVAGMGGQLCGCVTPLIAEYKRIVLDLGEVEYMDSLGLGRWCGYTYRPRRVGAAWS